MKGISNSLAVVVLSGVVLFSSAVQAMPIAQFDKLTHKQQGEYAVFLIESAANILSSQGDTAGAAKIRDLFENSQGQSVKPALVQFVENTNAARNINQQNAGDPNFKPIQVEQALSLTLRNLGISVPASKLLQVSQTWKPSGK
jgi:hypothetical protein